MDDRRRLRTLGQACTAFRRPCTHSMNVVSCGSGLHTADLWCSFPHLQQYVALRRGENVSGWPSRGSEHRFAFSAPAKRFADGSGHPGLANT